MGFAPDGSVLWDAHVELKRAASTPFSGGAELIERATRTMLPILKRMMKDLSKLDPTFFSREVIGSTRLNLAVFRFESGRPMVWVRDFHIRADKKGGWLVQVQSYEPTGLVDEGEAWYKVLGERSWIARLRQQAGLPKGDRADVVRKLVELEIQNDKTGSVAAPVNVLVITEGAAEWVDPKPPCGS